MKIEEVKKQISTPLGATPYPPGPSRFTDREYVNIVHRTDPDALRAAVPEPLTPLDGTVRFEVMRMGDATGFGPYTEIGQVIPVTYTDADGNTETGEYLHAMYLDNFGATAAGRELSAYPKVMAETGLKVESGALVGTLDMGSERVVTATMGYKHRPLDLDEARGQITRPTFMLKVLLDATTMTPRQHLVRTRITDIRVKWAFEGPARLQYFEHVMAPLADLPVRGIVSASHIMTDLTLAPAAPVVDYRAASEETGEEK